MKYLEAVIMLPLAILGLFLMVVVDLVRVAQGKTTVDEEWHGIYMDSNMNHGQGPMTRESGLKPVSEDDDTITQQYYTGL